MPPPPQPPASILIIGSGEFGLTTALSLALRPYFSTTKITLLDRHVFPAPDAASIDTSRIVRADYSDPAYARLCQSAQRIWRGEDPAHPLHGIGLQGRYNQVGLVLTGEEGGYVDGALVTVDGLGARCEPLKGREDVDLVCGTGGGLGTRGYVNWDSGWADAGESVAFLRKVIEGTGRVQFGVGEAVRVLEGDGGVVRGVELRDGTEVLAELTVIAAGAWTPALVDLRGRCVATGQVLAYVRLDEPEWELVKDMPVVFNLSTGIFVIAHPNRTLKLARHAPGYLNPAASGISVPRTAVTHPGQHIPAEARLALLAALGELVPALSGRELDAERLCWYTDTASGDFLVAHHPEKRGLFLATGGSGHAFKFLPALGEHVVDILQGVVGAEFTAMWGWPRVAVDEVVTRDGSRSGEQVVL